MVYNYSQIYEFVNQKANLFLRKGKPYFSLYFIVSIRQIPFKVIKTECVL